MSELSLFLLGRFEVCSDATPVTKFPTDKTRALLAYLALEPRQHARRELAALLWPDADDKYALTNLRNTLHRLRQTLDAAAPNLSDELLNVSRRSVQINVDRVIIDARRFQTLVEDNHGQEKSKSTEVTHLAEAVDLYRGELMAGFGLADAPAFEEWLLLHRETLHQRAILAFHTLAGAYESAGQHDRAHAVASRLLWLDPYREDSHRQVMRLLALMGQPDQALRQFEQMRQLFQSDMNVPPSQQTLDLARSITTGDFGQSASLPNRTTNRATVTPSPLHPATPHPSLRPSEFPMQLAEADSLLASQQQPSPLAKRPGEGWGGVDLSEVPDPGPFFGRMRERQQLKKWIQRDRCRVVAILGIGGMGKTSLAAQCVRELARENDGETFNRIFWRSLLNAPPLPDLLPPLLQVLSDQQLTDVPQNLDDQLRLLNGYLRDQRVLLVLDNMESILEPERAGAFRAGYEPYGQFIQQVATLEHGSHLLLTSRERPRGYARLEGDSALLQTLQLEGLDDSAGHELLQQRGLRGESQEESSLITRYSGNPLALKLVADTVDEIFGGDIEEFLAEESLVFDDIRTVLDQHFDRLSQLERELLFWLTVEREPTTVSGFRQNLLRPPSQRALLEALRNLQRRSLVERRGTGFALQNVVTEYLSDRLVEEVSQEIITGNLDLLHRHALLKAQTKEYVRQSQARLILGPISERLLRQPHRDALTDTVRGLLDQLRRDMARTPSYAGGNILNLSLFIDLDITGFDFSRLCVWQAALQGATLSDTNFAGADLADSAFLINFGRVKSVAISPDSKHLAIGTDDGEVRLFNLPDGQLVSMLYGHIGLVNSLAFSSDSQRLVSCSGLEGTIYIWDVGSGQAIQSLQGHHSGVNVVTFSPDGELIASGCKDRAIRLWDARSGEILNTIMKHEDWVESLSFNPDGTMLASSSLDDEGSFLWQIERPGTCVTEQSLSHEQTEDAQICQYTGALEGQVGGVRCVVFSPDGLLLATCGDDNTCRLWNIKNNSQVKALHGHTEKVMSLVFSPDGRLLFSGSHDFTVRIWDVASGRTLNVLRYHTHQIWTIALSGDGNTLASGGSDGAVCLWDVSDHQLARPFRVVQGHVEPFYSMAISPDGRVMATGEGGGRVRLWDLEQPRLETRLLAGHENLVDSVAFSPDGLWLASGGQDGTVRIWDVESGRNIQVSDWRTPDWWPGTRVTFHPNGRLVASSVHTSIFVWDALSPADTQTLRHLQGHQSGIRALAFSPDGAILASCSSDDTVRLWDVRSGDCIHVIDEHIQSFWSIVFSPTGDYLAGGGRSGIHIWDMRGNSYARIPFSQMAATSSVRPVVFSADGRQLVSGGVDRTMRVWDVDSDIELQTMRGHAADIVALAFLPNGRVVASASYDGSIRFWDIETGETLQILRIPGPYEGMNISGVTGISDAQREALKALGAVEE